MIVTVLFIVNTFFLLVFLWILTFIHDVILFWEQDLNVNMLILESFNPATGVLITKSSDYQFGEETV